LSVVIAECNTNSIGCSCLSKWTVQDSKWNSQSLALAQLCRGIVVDKTVTQNNQVKYGEMLLTGNNIELVIICWN